MKTRSILTIVTVIVLSLIVVDPAGAQSSVGIYNDASGSTCSLTAPSSGQITAYVVVRPGPGGTTGLQFAAPKPSCFQATHLGDATPPGVLTIGDSQTGISVALGGCFAQPVHALTIEYLATGTTPTCCEYPIVNDPSKSDILVVDCAFNELVATGVVSTFNADLTCLCSGNSAPNIPDNPDPANGANNVGVHASLSWIATDIDNNLAEFDVYLGTDPSPPLVATVTEQTYTPPAPLTELTTHYWRVVARDAGGLEQSGSVWTFSTRALNSPPEPPFSPYPFDGAEAIAENITLIWQGDDIDGDTLAYDVYFGTTATPPLVATNRPASYTPPTLAFDTRHYWRVVARDPMGLETSGPVWDFTTKLENYPPGPPSFPSPPNAATVLPDGVNLSWVATDADGDSLTFDLYIGTTLPPPLFDTGIPTMNYALPGLTGGARYYWKIVAHDDVTETSGPVWYFNTAGANLPPTAPSNPSPPDSAIGVASPATLQWTSTDPNGDPVRFDVYFGDTSPPPLWRTNLASPSTVTGPLVPERQYFWRVVARDSHGAETTGAQWNFTAKPNSPPLPPSSPTPADMAVNRPINSTLGWQCSDPDLNSITYDIYFGTMSPPPLVKTDHTLRNYAPGMLAFDTDYYWMIVARDGFGAETPGPQWAFRTGSNSPPNAPSNPFPGNGAIASTSPTLYWVASDPDGQALTFDVYFGTASNPPLVAPGLVSSTYQPGQLQAEVTYYWRVVASDGEYSTSGPTWSFLAGVPVGGGASTVEIYADQSGTMCSLSDVTPGLQYVYVFVRPVGGATGLQFSAPKPDCYTAYYLGEDVTPGLLSIGNTQDGISLALGGCVDVRMPVVTIAYFGIGTTLPCCEYPVLPDPGKSGIIVVDCLFSEEPCSGVSLTINEADYCSCGALLPVLISNFEARAVDDAVEVRWELAGDETAEQFTVLRRAGDATNPQVVGEGAVTGSSGSYLDTSVEPGVTYHYELLVRTADGNEFRSPVATVTTTPSRSRWGRTTPTRSTRPR